LGQKQTCAAHKPMSAKCQKRTSPHPIISSARYNVGGICGDSTGARVGFPPIDSAVGGVPSFTL
jgi:hypothetical protein